MTPHLFRFDLHALHAALDAERRSRNLTWVQVLQEINIAFEGTPSIPISMGTIQGLAKKSSVTSAVVLQVLRWLKRTPESFLAGRTGPAHAGEELPRAGRGQVLRFDTQALHAALDVQRLSRGLTWKQVAAELPGFTPAMLTNLATGPLIGFPRVMLLTQWLAQPAANFVHVCSQ